MQLQVRRGLEADIPTLAEGEPGFSTDSKKLFIGSSTGNTQIGAQGAAGESGVGVPEGGTTGQVLAKNSDTNFDTGWVDQSAGSGSPTIQKIWFFTAAGTGTAATAAGTAGSTTVNLTGISPTNGTFLTDQRIIIKGRQYRIASNVTASSGSATVTVSPALDETLTAETVKFNVLPIPENCSEIIVRRACAGGAGGKSSGGGGGAGEGAVDRRFKVTPNTEMPITVGGGGAGAASGSASNGGTTSVGSLLSLTGGSAAGTSAPGAAGGALATAGTGNIEGATTTLLGQGGGSIFGPGAPAGLATEAYNTKYHATIYGAGGSAHAARDVTGTNYSGNGAPGAAEIELLGV